MFAFSLVALALQASPDLAAGQKLYDAMQFRAAEARLRLAREQPESDAELDEVLYLLAKSLSAQRRLREAQDVYAELLARSPMAEAPSDVAPTLAEAFVRAKEQLYPRDFVRLRLQSLPAAAFAVNVIDPWRQVKSLVLSELLSTGDTRATVLPPVATTIPASPPDVSARSLEALNANGTRVAYADLVPVAAPSPAAVAVREALPPEPAQATLSRWPEWTLVALGALAAGAGVGLAVSASSDYRAAEAAHWASDTRTLGSRGQAKAVAANITFGTALAAGAAATVLWTVRF